MVALPVTATQVSSQSTSAMSAVTPYRPRVAAAPAQPTVFGVPMTQLCQAGTHINLDEGVLLIKRPMQPTPVTST